VTPEEKKVVQLAIAWRREIPGRRTKSEIDLESAIWELIVRCSECNTDSHRCPGDGNWIAHGETDCGEHAEDPGDIEPVWNGAEFRWVLPGDRVRLGGQEALIESVFTDTWHAAVTSNRDEQGRMWDKVSRWKHAEVMVRLAGRAAPLTFQPSLEIEILCDYERTVQLLMQRELGGDVSPWPQEARDWNRKVMQSEKPAVTYVEHRLAAQRMGATGRSSVWKKP
jgi:hypothetical protein